MAKKTKTPEELEWEATREERDRLLYRRLNEVTRRALAEDADRTEARRRRRLFPWRVRLERLD